MPTKAVRLVRNKHLAGGGYLQLSTQHSFDDEVLDLSHQHWNGQKWKDIRYSLSPLKNSCVLNHFFLKEKAKV